MIQVDREKKIAISGFIILLGFILSAFYHYFLGVYKGMGYPYNTFLFLPSDQWMDFINLVRISQNPYAIVRGWSNFPFLYRFAWLFRIGPINLMTTAFIFSFVVLFIYICWKNVKTPNQIETAKNVLILTLFSYPILISIDRANFEIVVFACLYGYFNIYKKDPFVASIFLALAVALKIFPAILALLFLADKKYKEFLFVAGFSLFLTLASYASYPGGVIENIKGNLANINLYNIYYVGQNIGFAFGNSLFGAIKFIVYLVNPGLIDKPAATAFILRSIPYYYIFTFVVLFALFAYIAVVEKGYWKKVAILICALNLLPQVSGDYKLLHLFIVLFFFINDAEHERWDMLYLILLSLLLIPKDYYHLPAFPEASLSVFLNPVLMIILLAVIIGTGLRKYHLARAATESGPE
jgi:hypothetical protein